MKDAEQTFQRLCHEAVMACGSDMAAIERYVTERLHMMDAADRERIKRDLDRVLGFRAPGHQPLSH